MELYYFTAFAKNTSRIGRQETTIVTILCAMVAQAMRAAGARGVTNRFYERRRMEQQRFGVHESVSITRRNAAQWSFHPKKTSRIGRQGGGAHGTAWPGSGSRRTRRGAGA